ncbi:MAG: cytochrome c peroxidase [Planctomycetota bacterium]
MRGLVAVTLICLVAPSSGPGGSNAAVKLSERERQRIFQHSPLKAIPADPTNRFADNSAAAQLGQYLFFDTQLSGNGEVACATCHVPELGFSDGRHLAKAIGELERHTPSLWNVAYNRWFFWDGRADSLWSQAVEPLENPREMGGNRMQMARRVWSDPALRKAYEQIFAPLPNLGDEKRFPPQARPVPEQPQHPEQLAWQAMSEEDRRAVNRILVNLTKAISAYERKFLSRNAPFDRFVKGLRSGDREQLAALSPSALRGLKLFMGRANCRLCHHGPNFTDGEFHNTRVPPLDGKLPSDSGRYQGLEQVRRNPFNAASEYSDAPGGVAAAKVRSLVQGPQNWGLFKTPSLRNVALSPPYMHQGQFATLHHVVRYYSTLEEATGLSHHQETTLLPLNLTCEEMDDLVAFLESLSDASLDVALLKAPGTPLGAKND